MCSCARVLVCSCARVLVCFCARVLLCSCACSLVCSCSLACGGRALLLCSCVFVLSCRRRAFSLSFSCVLVSSRLVPSFVLCCAAFRGCCCGVRCCVQCCFVPWVGCAVCVVVRGGVLSSFFSKPTLSFASNLFPPNRSGWPVPLIRRGSPESEAASDRLKPAELDDPTIPDLSVDSRPRAAHRFFQHTRSLITRFSLFVVVINRPPAPPQFRRCR